MIIRLKHIYILVLFILSSFTVGAQNKYSIKGTVLDATTKQPIIMAVVGIKEMNIWTVTDCKGTYSIDGLMIGEYTLQSSFISYQDFSEKIEIYGNVKDKRIFLSLTNIALKEVCVTANELDSPSTSSQINREAISHLQPSSFSELLELLPGNSYIQPKLSGVNTISIRQVDEEVNTSLGASFIIDGTPISNDANLQTTSRGWSTKISKRNSTATGIDMRTISTDDIESVEIIRGIPSVRYGDLNSGLINIKRKQGYSPYKIRIKSDPHSKMAFLGKGYTLSNSSSINIGFDYLDYKSDPRDLFEQYKRCNTSIRYNNRFKFEKDILFLKTSFDYTGSFDDDKQDKEVRFGINDYYSSSYNKFRLSSSLKWNRLGDKIFKGIDFRFTSSYAHDVQFKNTLVSVDRDIPRTSTRVEGIHDGIFIPNEYEAYIEEDGKPVNVFANISTVLDIPIGVFNNKLLFGVDYKYDKNFGRGELYDPNRPHKHNSLRPRAYDNIPSQQRIASFVEDKVSVDFSDFRFNLVAGLRSTKLLNLNSKYDISNNIFIEPRLNLQLKFPDFVLLGKDVTFSINAGIGEHKRFPVLYHLYPDLVYADLVQLNYFHDNKDYRRVSFDTHIIDPTNYSISEASNKKIEIGINFNVDGNRFFITAFKEVLSSGFRNEYDYRSFVHKKYDNQSVDYDALTGPPLLEDMTFALDTTLVTYQRTGNLAHVVKRGVEFQFDFKRFESIFTKLTINGAWLKTSYADGKSSYKSKDVVLNGKTINLLAEYPADIENDKERFNTNFRFDTQVPSMGLVFSSLIECTWYSSTKKIWNNNRPISYIDECGTRHIYTEESEQDYRLRWLRTDSNFNINEQIPFAAYVNFKVTKRFSKHMFLSMYVNRVVTYTPSYMNNGYEINRRINPSFGMEIRINI